jgi:hypothetical protein
MSIRGGRPAGIRPFFSEDHLELFGFFGGIFSEVMAESEKILRPDFFKRSRRDIEVRSYIRTQEVPAMLAGFR